MFDIIYFFFTFRNDACSIKVSTVSRQMRFRKELYEYYVSCFVELRKGDIIRKDLTVDKYETLAFPLIMQHTLWFECASPTYDDYFRKKDFLVYLTNLLYPYLTETGKRELDRIKKIKE